MDGYPCTVTGIRPKPLISSPHRCHDAASRHEKKNQHLCRPKQQAVLAFSLDMEQQRYLRKEPVDECMFGGGGRSRWEEGGAGMWLQQPPNKMHSEWTGSVFVTCPRQQDIGYFCRVCITFRRVSLSALYSHRCGRCGWPCSSGSSSSNSAKVLRSDTTILFD